VRAAGVGLPDGAAERRVRQRDPCRKVWRKPGRRQQRHCHSGRPAPRHLGWCGPRTVTHRGPPTATRHDPCAIARRNPHTVAPPTVAPPTVARSRAITRPPSPPTRKRAGPRKPAKPKLPAADKTPGTPRKKAAVAGPRAGVRRTPPAEPSTLDRLQRAIVASLEDDGAEAVVTLDLAGKASFCDRMVVATGQVDRQITAMAQHLAEKLEQEGVKRIQVEGAAGADWVLIDAGDIVVHLFKPEARAMYALEKMWGADLDEVTTPA
jgi:ribosome-associated protein